MGAQRLSSRAIIGAYYLALEQNAMAGWVDKTSNLFTSDQESESYAWLGQSPVMREWVGGRDAKGFRDNGIDIKNLHFEATMQVLVDELRRDKTGQVLVRINDLAERTNAHWAKLLTTLRVNGESAVCYDGQYFYDTDHTEGDSGNQSNDLTFAASTGTTPTAAEMADAILQATEACLGFLDDQGEPMNENAKGFLVTVPVALMKQTAAALGSTILVQNATTTASNTIMAVGSLGGFTYEMAVNARLSNAAKFYVDRIDGVIKPFIRQQETAVQMSAIAEGSEEEFKKNRHLYGVDTWRNVGYGFWQRSVLTTFT